jgi:hypothetical protein
LNIEEMELFSTIRVTKSLVGAFYR